MAEHKLFYKYFDEWIDIFKEPVVSKATLATYRNAAKAVKKLAPDLYLDEMTRMSYQKIVNEYGKTHELGTVKNFLRCCNASLNDAYHDHVIDTDIRYKVKAVSFKKHKVTRMKVLEVDQAERLEKVLKKEKSPVAKLCDFVLRTGLRIGEALGITPADVDFDSMTVDINKTYKYKQEHNPDDMFAPTKNEASVRNIVIDNGAKEDLEACMDGVAESDPIFVMALIKAHTKEYARQQRSKNSSNLFQLQKKIKFPAANVALNQQLSRYCQKANVPRITLHNLRHTHASLLITNKISIQSLADRLGHASTATTEKIYVHLLKKQKNEDETKMKEALSKL